MFAKLRTTFFALIVALPAGWGTLNVVRALADHVREADRMGDWVVVRATPLAPRLEGLVREYRYPFDGREYVGSQLGVGGEGRASFGYFIEDTVAFLDEARQAGRTVTVYVNPDNPSQAVVDRYAQTGYLVGMGFLLVFCGSFALGAIAIILYVWVGSRSPNAKAWREAGFLWMFGLIWSLFSFAITFAVLPDILANGEWAGLLVLLFPLIGVLLLFAAVVSTLKVIKLGFTTRGSAGAGEGSLSLDRKATRLGDELEGTFTFPRHIKHGEMMRLRVVCDRKQGGRWTPVWFREATENAVSGPDGPLARFGFTLPPEMPAAPGASADDNAPSRWRLEAVQVSGKWQSSFPLRIRPAVRSAERDPALDQVFGDKR